MSVPCCACCASVMICRENVSSPVQYAPNLRPIQSVTGLKQTTNSQYCCLCATFVTCLCHAHIIPSSQEILTLHWDTKQAAASLPKCCHRCTPYCIELLDTITETQILNVVLRATRAQGNGLAGATFLGLMPTVSVGRMDQRACVPTGERETSVILLQSAASFPSMYGDNSAYAIELAG
jgi:hypothetical protein